VDIENIMKHEAFAPEEHTSFRIFLKNEYFQFSIPEEMYM